MRQHITSIATRHVVLRLFSKQRGPFIEKPNAIKTMAKKLPNRPPTAVSSSTGTVPKQEQIFDHLLVLDFEATCIRGTIRPCNEIIEFPVVKISTQDWKVKGKFHEYVRPTANPKLSSFCTELTGIIQEMVDGKPTIQETLARFDAWMIADEDLKPGKFAFVTCGDWDLKLALPQEAVCKNFTFPSYFHSWINIKHAYATHTGSYEKGISGLLKAYELQFKGREHSGIDDVTNICEIARCLGESGHVFKITGSTQPGLAPIRRFTGI